MPDEIPLSTVKSRASSTGARKANQSAASFSDSGDLEKKRSILRAGGRRKAPDGPSRAGTGEETKLNAMGRLYTRIINFAPPLRYLVYIVPVGLALAVPLIVLPLTDNKDAIPVGSRTDTVDGDEIAWLTLWAGKLVAFILPALFMFFCGVVSSGTRKYATVLRNLVLPLSFFFWALASWLTFRGLFKDALNIPIDWCRNFERVLGASFVSSAVYLAEKAIVQLIGISYHQRSFANRIHDSKHEIRLLGMLGSATPMRLIGDVGRLGDKVTSVFGNIASEITGKQVFNPNSAHSIVVEALEKVKSSEALGRRIWMSFAVEDQDSLKLEDLIEVLGPEHRERAEEAFIMVDGDGNGDISLEEMVRKVTEIGKERKAISEGMKDIGQALQVFDKVLLFVVLLIVVFIFLAFFQSSFITTLATAGTALLSLSFVFAVTTQEFLGSCIFLFVKHPYDVGDRVDIAANGEKLALQVEKISLLYTVFVRIDRMQIVQTPNIQLNNMWIENVSRSKAMKECVDVNISYDTTFDDVELLRMEMEKFVRHPDNSRDFQPDFSIGVGSVGDLDKLNLKIVIKHKSNWHNDGVRATRRSKFICALAAALKKVPIYGPGGGNEALGSVGNPSYSVTVTDEHAAKNRQDASDTKESKRMVATNIPDPLSTAEALNAPPGGDDWFNRDDNKTINPPEHTRVSLDRGDSTDYMKRNESHKGLRKAGESLSTGSVHSRTGAPPMSINTAMEHPIGRTTSRRTYDEEAQLGSPRSPRSPLQPGGFAQSAVMGGMMQSSASGYSVYPMGSVQEVPTPGVHPSSRTTPP
ncbi:unnamed protein product [Parascedosporium putredinis]|uniref:Mechanosensitive ion channel protein n=1 Tax=Parascedosporium putredinis TaxID=1442378 RepID=A0A9P1GWZ8_9PEZI|nr:unnamed protein product [Parascedosporium putredinis]CAI7989300.1 unnamed protein product [Parascedosporium putredinis]